MYNYRRKKFADEDTKSRNNVLNMLAEKAIELIEENRHGRFNNSILNTVVNDVMENELTDEYIWSLAYYFSMGDYKNADSYDEVMEETSRSIKSRVIDYFQRKYN